MSRSEWGFNTDFDALFLKLVLLLAIKNKVPKDEMIKRISVFSDMQFDCASTKYDPTNSKTNRNVVERRKQGTMREEGVAFLHGYSPSLLKVFMDVEEDEEGFEVLDNSGGKVTRKQDFTPEENIEEGVGQQEATYNGLASAVMSYSGCNSSISLCIVSIIQGCVPAAPNIHS
ncbi:hypothetical protein PAXINDRAFT_13921 [Paxillus involutus ATCC 200175]|uniref:DUF7788 domain-containing protein n=1 Tax=Paxillus involutus ATCC 200175 TaxID=664439 RepID=A0A0C9U0U1_PAXIN|nr:hypothetical protein PAXINDRAFT_13921 [Paxillus involutus ATCC 200175]